MKHRFAAFLAAIAFVSAHAEAQEEGYGLKTPSLDNLCREGPTKECWKAAADILSSLAPPGNDRQRSELAEGYWALGRASYATADFADSKGFYGLALKWANTLSPDGKSDTPRDFLHTIIAYDMAALDLSTHDYAAALGHLDEFSLLEKKSFKPATEDDSTRFFRAAAMIGLEHTAEADQLLESLKQGLNLEGEYPWEGFPFGPQPLDPYQTGRRIAAHYLKEQRFDDALALLRTLETAQQKMLPYAREHQVRGGYWATRLASEDIMEDEADVLIAQGKDDEAEKILKTSLLGREKKRNWQLRNVLEKLAVLEKRNGRAAEAAEYSQRAESIVIKSEKILSDPLKDTLGLANSAGLED